MPVSSLCGYLPPPCSMSIIIDATGGYPRGVWYSDLLNVTARPATEAPVAAPNAGEPTNTARTATSVALGTPLPCQLGTYG